MNLASLFPPTLLARLLDDIGAIADAARSLPRFEREVTLRLDTLTRELAPIQLLPAVQREIEAMRSLLDAMNLQLQTLEAVRVGIEPLDEDMRAVRDSVDGLEPSIAQVNTRLEALDMRIDALRAELAPLGELADKIPGIG